MTNIRTEVYPHRVLWLVPVILLSGFINDFILSTLFTFVMALVTSRLFPIVVRKEIK